MMSAQPAEDHAPAGEMIELELFKCLKEAYVYQVPPATTQHGHRAELWNLNKWLAEVSVRVIRRTATNSDTTLADDAVIRLQEPTTGELFAEAPVNLPLRTCIEPVIDSSRYFVIRIADAATGAHAFVGLGFRDREFASDFVAALDDYAKYVDRQRRAEEMKHSSNATAATTVLGGENGVGSGANTTTAQSNSDDQQQQQQPTTSDLSLKPGESLNLRVDTGSNRNGGFVSGALGSNGSGSRGKLAKTFSLMFGKEGDAVAALAPPPKQYHINESVLPMGVSPSRAASSGEEGALWGDFASG